MDTFEMSYKMKMEVNMVTEGIDKFDVKIIDPFNEHRSDYVWLRFKACYPKIYPNVVDILKSPFNNIFIVTYKVDDSAYKLGFYNRMVLFDYDTEDIYGVIGQPEFYVDILTFIQYAPVYGYFVDDEGNRIFVDDVVGAMKGNSIGLRILEIVAELQNYTKIVNDERERILKNAVNAD